MKKEIKSIKQISQDMQKAKQQFDYLMNYFPIPALTMEQDLELRAPTISKILKDLPQQQRLKEMLEHPYAETPQIRQRILGNYKGKYEIIKKAAQNIKNLKFQAEKLYYLAAELNLYKIKCDFDSQKPPQLKLKSYQISKNQNCRMPKYQKNTMSSTYIRQLKQQQNKMMANPNTIDCLTLGESLIHINLYDSINGQKIYEYVCYGDQTLLDIVSKFYCLIARLEGKDGMHHANSYCLIQENFYYNGHVAKKKIQEIIAFSDQNLEEEYNMEPLQKNSLIYEMGKTKLKNLRVVFGRPYLFRHLEGCDHIIIFKDLRILTQNQLSDPIKKQKYPLAVFEGRMRRRKCDGCRTKFADIVSLNDGLKGGKHLYLCQNCHSNLHGESEVKEQGTFIKYIHD